MESSDITKWCEKLFNFKIKKIEHPDGEISFQKIYFPSESVLLRKEERLTQEDVIFIENIYFNKERYLNLALKHYNRNHDGILEHPFFTFYIHKNWQISFYTIDIKRKCSETVTIVFKGVNIVNIKYERDEDWGNNLHTACEQRDVHQVKVLLEDGANPNGMDHYGQTALFIAIDSDLDATWQSECAFDNLDFSLTKLLLSYGGDLSIKNHEGISPMDLVLDYGDEVYTIFKEQIDGTNL